MEILHNLEGVLKKQKRGLNNMSNENEHLNSDIILYTTDSGDIKVEVLFSDESFWLNQKRTAELFGVEVNTMNYLRKEIYTSLTAS